MLLVSWKVKFNALPSSIAMALLQKKGSSCPTGGTFKGSLNGSNGSG